MNKELEQKLFKKYPLIFKQKDLPPTESNMCFGFDCGDGWYTIIDVLCSRIQSHINTIETSQKKIKLDNNVLYKIRTRIYLFFISIFKPSYKKSEDNIQIEAVQVKEKFGGLRFYTNFETEYISALIDMAESMSYRTCEECGTTKDAEPRGGGWIQTLCEKCFEKE